MSAAPFRRRHTHYQPLMPSEPDLWAVARNERCAYADFVEQSLPTYSGDLDGERLTSQLDAVLALMQDGQWRTLGEIRAAVGRGSEAGLSARLREIRASHRGVVERRRRGDPKAGLWEYCLHK